MRKKILFFLPILLFLLMTYTITEAKIIPNFLLPSAVDNKKVSSKQFENKVLLVTFFATWCPPCREEVPTLKRLQKELRKRGFSVLAFSVDESGSKIVQKLITQEKINYPVLMSNRAVMKGFGGISGIPTSFLVNRKGNIVRSYSGYIPYKLLKKHIDRVMKE